MILSPLARHYDLANFNAYMRAAAEAVVRVRVAGSPIATGWLIAPSLVIVPDFAVTDAQEFECDFSDAEQNISVVAELVHHQPGGPAKMSPAILRIAGEGERSPLRLHVDTVPANAQVIVVHHPRGMDRARLSFGWVTGIDGDDILHDAATEGGSSGGPLLEMGSGSVIGIHYSGEQSRGNAALSLTAVLESLRSTPYWAEIAAAHRLANLSAAHIGLESDVAEQAVDESAVVEPELVTAALRWSFNRGTFSSTLTKKLRPMVVNPESETWSLTSQHRRNLLASAGSLDTLRVLHRRDDDSGPGQSAIDQVLDGGPYNLDEVSDADLPYWLQVTRWFADVVPDLPSPGIVARELSRRRVRGSLRQAAGPNFRGRTDELKKLTDWYHDEAAGAASVSGIGGVGKSALVATFALSLPDETLLLWLDFDRPDLVPDDAVSVVGLLAEQVSTQLDDTSFPPPTPETWQATLDALGQSIIESRRSTLPPLLVLDGFEIAQYAEQYHEIWQVLEEFARRVPALRLIVSGRAPVKDLAFKGRTTMNLQLTGLAEGDSRAWLVEQGLQSEKTIDRVLQVANGVPLILKLALHLWETGGEIDVPDELPRVLVDAYLYRRILDRVVDPDLQPVARDALVLRQLTPEIIAAVLYDVLPTETSVDQVFERLSREMALVDELDRSPLAPDKPQERLLRVRPELRAATLRLLELTAGTRVVEIDRRAAHWYAAQDADDPAVAAELVYHHLRLGEVTQATQRMRDDAAPLLVGAEADIPDRYPEARTWLSDREQRGGADDQLAWEQSAYERIRTALERGANSAVDLILAERSERNPQSPLVLYDAWTTWQSGDVRAARRILEQGNEPGRATRDRAILAARLAAEEFRVADADDALAAADDRSVWLDWEQGPLAALAVRAARLRLTVDLKTELKLSARFDEEERAGNTDRRFLDGMKGAAAPGDYVLPRLARRFESAEELVFESIPTSRLLEVPLTPEQRFMFRYELDEARSDATDTPVPPELRLSAVTEDDLRWAGIDIRVPESLHRELDAVTDDGLRTGLDFAALGVRRWYLASEDDFLADACALAIGSQPTVDPLAFAVLGTLGCLCGYQVRYSNPQAQVNNTLTEILNIAMSRGVATVQGTAVDVETVRLVLDGESRDEAMVQQAEKVLSRSRSNKAQHTLGGSVSSTLDALIVYLIGPDPLDILLRRVLGLPAI